PCSQRTDSSSDSVHIRLAGVGDQRFGQLISTPCSDRCLANSGNALLVQLLRLFQSQLIDNDSLRVALTDQAPPGRILVHGPELQPDAEHRDSEQTRVRQSPLRGGAETTYIEQQSHSQSADGATEMASRTDARERADESDQQGINQQAAAPAGCDLRRQHAA